MFIVRRKSEVLRFGLFLVLIAAIIYYVSGKIDLWRTAQGQSAARPGAVGGQSAPGAQPSSPALGGARPPADPDSFAELRMERERNRGALTERLKEVMDNQNADADVRKQASQQYLDAGRIAALEGQAEELVRARGFPDAFVTISGGNVNVVVKSASLSQPQSLQVIDTVSRAAQVKPQAVQVSYKAH